MSLGNRQSLWQTGERLSLEDQRKAWERGELQAWEAWPGRRYLAGEDISADEAKYEEARAKNADGRP